MKQHAGDMWSVLDEVDLFLITTNSFVTREGKLVMGRGIAYEARVRFPGLDQRLGKAVRRACTDEHGYWQNPGTYQLLISPNWPRAKLGLFQVKTYWSQTAKLHLIRESATQLAGWCEQHPAARVALNFPGIGNGGLSREEVLLFLEVLPDTVEIWQFKR